MIEYYNKVHEEALKTLRMLTGQDVEDSLDDVRKAVHWVKCHGTRLQACYAKEAWFDFMWSHHEIEAHKAEAKAAAPVVK